MNHMKFEPTPAGFWIRLSALLIDVAIVWGITIALIFFVALAGFYMPAEASFIIIVLVYFIASNFLWGQTIGKKILGIKVLTCKYLSPSLLRVVFRETICKTISGAIFFIGFVITVFSKKKRGLHDYMAGTIVVKNDKALKHPCLTYFLITFLAVTLCGQYIVRELIFINDFMKISIKKPIATAYATRDPATLKEIKEVTEKDMFEYAEWLINNKTSPEDFIVQSAKEHQLTILGEHHNKKENLLLLKRIIPRLYHEAGVRRIGLEICIAKYNKQLEDLVTSKDYDFDLALNIFRHDVWKGWGYREYLDILEAVWELNRDLPENSEKMLVFGLDREWDLQSMELAGFNIGDTPFSSPIPIWERLRFFRIIFELPLLFKRDEVMARNIQKEIFEKDKRGLVLAGGSHAYVRYRQAMGKDEWSRMGFLLHHEYGEEVYQITLHGALMHGFTDFIDQIASVNNLSAFAFEVPGSPLEMLRDNNELKFQPNVNFSDLTIGYVFIKPFDELHQCQWIDGYISQQMFLKNKPFYEGEFGRGIKNSEDANIAAKERLFKVLENQRRHNDNEGGRP